MENNVLKFRLSRHNKKNPSGAHKSHTPNKFLNKDDLLHKIVDLQKQKELQAKTIRRKQSTLDVKLFKLANFITNYSNNYPSLRSILESKRRCKGDAEKGGRFIRRSCQNSARWIERKGTQESMTLIKSFYAVFFFIFFLQSRGILSTQMHEKHVAFLIKIVS